MSCDDDLVTIGRGALEALVTGASLLVELGCDLRAGAIVRDGEVRERMSELGLAEADGAGGLRLSPVLAEALMDGWCAVAPDGLGGEAAALAAGFDLDVAAAEAGFAGEPACATTTRPP